MTTDWIAAAEAFVRAGVQQQKQVIEYFGGGKTGYFCPDCDQPVLIAERLNHDCPKPYYVYFVQAETLGFVKIGYAKDVKSRLSGMQVDNPDRLTLRGTIRIGGRHKAERAERELQKKFESFRVRGEWFKPEVLSCLESSNSGITTSPLESSKP
jgi:T5orf172 domain